MTFTYQWLRCDAAGSNCAAIAGAVYSRYRPDATSKGYRLRAQITAQNANTSSSALTPASGRRSKSRGGWAARNVGPPTCSSPVRSALILTIPA